MTQSRQSQVSLSDTPYYHYIFVVFAALIYVAKINTRKSPLSTDDNTISMDVHYFKDFFQGLFCVESEHLIAHFPHLFFLLIIDLLGFIFQAMRHTQRRRVEYDAMLSFYNSNI